MNIRKSLGIAFGCHQKPDRSFFINGRQFPLCARCTGILIGYFIGIAVAIITKCQNHLYFLLLLIPMIIDGIIQKAFKKESNNIRRLLTGILGGIGIIYAFITMHKFTVWLAELTWKIILE